jgi:hypothetical protein
MSPTVAIMFCLILALAILAVVYAVVKNNTLGG